MTTIEATIDLGAVRRNIARVVDRIAPSKLMAVVKADAYGHGAVEVAQVAVARGVSWLGVLDAHTGVQLRVSGIDRRVNMFAWLFAPDEDYARLIDAGIDLGISHRHQLDRIAHSGASEPARLHLKIDTGLHRNGSLAADWPALISHALELQASGIVEIFGAWTHIGEASDDEDSLAIQRFEEAISVATRLGARIRVRHLAASAAGFARADARFDLVRTGAFLYGIAPGGGVGPADIGIEPAMTLSAPVTSIEHHAGISTAVIAAGWLDGIPVAAAGRVDIAIAGSRFKVSTVAADSMVAVGVKQGVQVGDIATLFGPGHDGEPTLDEWADALGTIGEEVAVGINPAVHRRYVAR